MLRIAICDDNRVHAEAAASHVAQALRGDAHQVEIFESGRQLLEKIASQPDAFQIVLMDIELHEGENGILIAQKINSLNSEIQIIFITGQLNWVNKAGRAENIYLAMKPVSADDLAFALEKAKSRLTHTRIALKTQSAVQVIEYHRILYVERRLRTSYVHIKDCKETIDVPDSLEQLLARLDRRTFCRCHKSFFVNMRHVEDMKPGFFTVYKEQVPISRNFYAAAKNALADYLGAFL